MSRYITIIITAALLLAACTKTEVAYDSPSEISFAPVAENVTKTAVEGKDYTDDLGFNVFANTIENVAYFANIPFKPGTEKYQSRTVYVGNPTQYWPRTKSLNFAGYTGDKHAGATVTANMSSLTLTNYTLDKGHDLMYFFIDGVDKNTTYIAPTMHHACSWITIKVTGENACADWLITAMTLNGVSTSGDVTFTDGDAEWSGLGTGEAIGLFSGSTKISDFTSVESIVIPQTPAGLTISYNGKTTDPAISLKYNGDNAWEAGKHYTYTLNFLNPYKIEFSVSGVEDWSGSQEIVIQ